MQVKIGDIRLLNITVLKDKKEIYKGKAEDAPKEIKNMQYNKIGFEGVDVIIEI